MHKLARELAIEPVALMEVNPGTAKALVCPGVSGPIVATVVAPLRKVNVSVAELVELLETTPEAATGLGLGPKTVLAIVGIG